ncbi:hypothetical protein PsYK624_140770 [Phanerochaete sordida]|uniref:Uncharacterized protein n=1 Tax=Phanerochaete sordida TaxID=48140 RepID=A0A9P3LJZ4_9APHY|nr:hypothetical protein PsYK624_140770 [Phanerochaete sordida]
MPLRGCARACDGRCSGACLHFRVSHRRLQHRDVRAARRDVALRGCISAPRCVVATRSLPLSGALGRKSISRGAPATCRQTATMPRRPARLPPEFVHLRGGRRFAICDGESLLPREAPAASDRLQRSGGHLREAPSRAAAASTPVAIFAFAACRLGR